MKTIEELQSIIDANLDLIRVESKTMRQSKRNSLLRENEKLAEIINYLKCSPSENFVSSEKIRLERIIHSKNTQYHYWLENCCPDDVPEKSKRTLFNKETGLVTLKRQLKNLNLILSL